MKHPHTSATWTLTISHPVTISWDDAAGNRTAIDMDSAVVVIEGLTGGVPAHVRLTSETGRTLTDTPAPLPD